MIVDTTSISKYNPLARSIYIKLPKELNHPRKGLIDIENIDNNECFKWRIVRYLNPADSYPPRITKADIEFAKKRDFRNIEFPIKIRDIYKTKKRTSLALAVLVIKIRKNIQFMYQKSVEKHVDLLFIEEDGKIYFHAWPYFHRGRKHFCRYCLQAFTAEDCFKINDKQRIIMPKSGEFVKFKNYEKQ